MFHQYTERRSVCQIVSKQIKIIMEKTTQQKERSVRADAQRNLDSLLEAAKKVFAISGVDAPVREIAEVAGVGLGTVYRHFPQRSDLITAVFKREIDDCANASSALLAAYAGDVALEKWLQRYSAFITTKMGMAPALHSGDPAYKRLRAYFDEQIRPALLKVLNAAKESGQIRTDIDAHDLLYAVGHLSMPDPALKPGHSERMVALLVDGLRHKS